MINPVIESGWGSAVFPTLVQKVCNSANDQAAWAFIALNNKNISAIDLAFNACAGTQALRKATGYLYSDVNGAVGALLATSTEITNFVNGAVSFPIAFTKVTGTRYWFIVKNTAAAPNTEYFSGVTYGGVPLRLGGTSQWGWSFATTANAWTSSTMTACSTNLLLTHTDSTYSGHLNNLTGANSTLKVYGTRGEGYQWVSPANASSTIAGFVMFVYTSSGTGNLVGKCKYGGTTKTAIAIPQANVASTTYQIFRFATPFTVPPGTTCYFYITSSGGDASHYYFTQYAGIANAAQYRAVIPWSLFYVSTTDEVTFTIDNTKIPTNFEVILDNSGEFVAPVFPLASKVNPDQLTYGFDGEYTASQDLPAITSVVPPDTLEGVTGTYDLAAYENGRNVPPALGNAALLTGQTAKIRNADYAGTVAAEAHTDDEVVDTATAPGNFEVSELANDKVMLGTAWGLGYEGTAPLQDAAYFMKVAPAQQIGA